MANGWSNLGLGRQKAYIARQGELLVLGGSLEWGDSPHLGTLPVNSRPKKRKVFLVNNGNQAARVDLSPEGRIVVKRGVKSSSCLSLDGMAFISPKERLWKD